MKKDKKCGNCEEAFCVTQKLDNGVETYLCMQCGFSTSTLMKFNSPLVDSLIEKQPELYKDLIAIGDDDLTWMPVTIASEVGMVFIDGTSKENWQWASIKNRPLTEEEKRRFPNESYKSDQNTLRHFPKRKFLLALASIEEE